MKPLKFLLLWLLILSFSGFPGIINLRTNSSQAASPDAVRILVLNTKGEAVDRLVDGNTIRLKVENLEPANNSRKISFLLDSSIEAASCEMSASQTSCESSSFSSLGWYWDASGIARPKREVSIDIDGVGRQGVASEVSISPRPVVLAHGFISDYTAFNNYLGPQGYLAKVGLHGYAVGDGQAPGVMNTGSIDAPQKRTNTILENANILGQYIQGVETQTGAEMVDLIVHSMGGLISRAYIDQVMQGRDVAQLIMLGSPMGGTDCSNLPAALGFYLPATIEIRPSYVEDIFNVQVTHRKGVPFYDLAGTPILEGIKSPCTAVPNDLVVSLQSVNSIPLQSEQLPVIHTELNTSEQVFNDFILPRLKTPAGSFQDQPDPALSGQAVQPVQFARMFTGTLKPGESADLTIPIDAGVSVASFALYDTSRSLEVKVTGASGKEIALSAEQNGLTKIDDPHLLFYLGYGFNNPKPGKWVIHLQATDTTPPVGAEYSMTANFTGGAILDAKAVPLIPEVRKAVRLSSNLALDGQAIQILSASASILQPDGQKVTIDLASSQNGFEATWLPKEAGLHGIDIFVTGADGTGQQIERTAFLSVDVLQSNPPNTLPWVISGICFFGLGVFIFLVMAVINRRKHLPNARRTGL